jgi:hypothetical protein
VCVWVYVKTEGNFVDTKGAVDVLIFFDRNYVCVIPEVEVNGIKIII